MDTSKDQEPAFLDRASRMTRGKMMTKLLDGENEEDEVFWNQDALKDEENDNNYEQEAEVADEFDSDFNEDEPEADDEAVKEVDVRMPRKRLIYPGKPSSKKKRKSVALSESPDKRGKTSQELTLMKDNDVQDEAEEEKVVRKSTRTSVVVRQAERNAMRAAIQATIKAIKRRKEGEEKRMTQEEMLLEAAQTEIMNLRNLERVLAREEEVKKRAVVHKIVYSGVWPTNTICFEKCLTILAGCSYLEFINGSSFHSDISTKTDPYYFEDHVEASLVALPRSLIQRNPYVQLLDCLPSTEIQRQDCLTQRKKLNQIIRQRYAAESARIEREMGSLFESLFGRGFLSRRKRLPVSNRSVSSSFEENRNK